MHTDPNSLSADQAGHRREDATVDEVPNGSSEATLPHPPACQTCQTEVPEGLAQHPRYRVLKLLGRGGMGTVYLAEHKVMERTVALKVIRPGLTDRPELVERFRREVKAAAPLAHPNIVAAYDAEQAGDCHFLAMEFVDGTDLARWLKARGPLPPAEACGYVRQAALGLQHAHEHHLVHRDLKPQNLMRTATGAVKILDFGLALLTRSAAESGTQSGIILGTPDYMAPEQADDAHAADIRSDIYSLGCTLYELLGGQPPFPGGSLLDKLRRLAQEQPAPLALLRPQLPAALVEVVERMMAKKPDQRFQTPGEVAAALLPWSGPPPETIALPGRPPEGRRWTFSRKLVLAAGAALMLVVGAVLVQIPRERGSGPEGDKELPRKGPEPGDLAPDLSRLKPEFDDDFSDPDKSHVDPWRKEHGATQFENNLCVLMLLTDQANKNQRGKPADVWSRRDFKVRDNFACQLIGRAIAPEGYGWSLLLWAEPQERSVAIRLRRDGRVEVGNCTWPGLLTSTLVEPTLLPTARPGNEFNTVLVLLRGQMLEVYLNGSAVSRPIRLENPLGPVHQGMALWTQSLGSDGEVRGEFKRFTLWRL